MGNLREVTCILLQSEETETLEFKIGLLSQEPSFHTYHQERLSINSEKIFYLP